LKYKNLNIAFLFEILIGFGTIISISLMGSKGLTALAFMILRPLILKREKIEDTDSYFKSFYKILFSSLSIISIMMISIVIITLFIPIWRDRLPSPEIMFVVILPFFLLTHGVIGYINLSIKE
jgi:hypothetical protein